MIQKNAVIIFLCFSFVIHSGMPFALQADDTHNTSSNTNITQMDNFVLQTNVSRSRNSAKETNVLTRMKNLHTHTNSTLQLLEDSASQTNVTHMGKFFQTNAIRANSASQSNVDIITRLGNLALQNNSTPQSLQHSPSQANVTNLKMEKSASQTNATRFGSLRQPWKLTSTVRK